MVRFFQDAWRRSRRLPVGSRLASVVVATLLLVAFGQSLTETKIAADAGPPTTRVDDVLPRASTTPPPAGEPEAEAIATTTTVADATTTSTTTAPTTTTPTTAATTTTVAVTTTTTAPTTTAAAAPAGCHPSYGGACLPLDAEDVDCAGGSGNGPVYTGRVEVVGPDVYDLDRDHDGLGCE